MDTGQHVAKGILPGVAARMAICHQRTCDFRIHRNVFRPTAEITTTGTKCAGNTFEIFSKAALTIAHRMPINRVQRVALILTPSRSVTSSRFGAVDTVGLEGVDSLYYGNTTLIFAGIRVCGI